MRLTKVLGFSRIVCYPCKKVCRKGYDEMDACYQEMLQTKREEPGLVQTVEKIESLIEEWNK